MDKARFSTHLSRISDLSETWENLANFRIKKNERILFPNRSRFSKRTPRQMQGSGEEGFHDFSRERIKLHDAHVDRSPRAAGRLEIEISDCVSELILLYFVRDDVLSCFS